MTGGRYGKIFLLMSTSLSTPATPPEPAPKNSPKAKMMTRAAVRHAAPFFLWIGIMLIASMMRLTESSGTEDIPSLNLISDAQFYALRTVLCIIAFLLFRPWKFYTRLNPRHVLPAIGVGLVVFVLWVGMETDWIRSLLPGIAEAYERWCVKPFGELREVIETPPYAPALAGWPLTLMRIVGSAFVIAIIEEFFWRGYLMRTLRTPDFLDIDIGEFHLTSFFIVVGVFGFQHVEWAAGIVTGILYGWFYLRTRDIWAVSIAHVITNLVLGLYVLGTGHWHFW